MSIKEHLKKAGYDHATAVATQAEIDAGAACGQLAEIEEDNWPKFELAEDDDEIADCCEHCTTPCPANTNDLNLRIKADVLGIDVQEYYDDKVDQVPIWQQCNY